MTKDGKYGLLRNFDNQERKHVFKVIDLEKVIKVCLERKRKQQNIRFNDSLVDENMLYSFISEDCTPCCFFKDRYLLFYKQHLVGEPVRGYDLIKRKSTKYKGIWKNVRKKERVSWCGKYRLCIAGPYSEQQFCIKDMQKNEIVFEKKSSGFCVDGYAVTKDSENILLALYSWEKYCEYSSVEIYKSPGDFFVKNNFKQKLLKNRQYCDVAIGFQDKK